MPLHPRVLAPMETASFCGSVRHKRFSVQQDLASKKIINMKMIIEIINSKWTVNGKLLHELSPNEKNALDQFIKSVDYEVNK